MPTILEAHVTNGPGFQILTPRPRKVWFTPGNSDHGTAGRGERQYGEVEVSCHQAFWLNDFSKADLWRTIHEAHPDLVKEMNQRVVGYIKDIKDYFEIMLSGMIEGILLPHEVQENEAIRRLVNVDGLVTIDLGEGSMVVPGSLIDSLKQARLMAAKIGMRNLMFAGITQRHRRSLLATYSHVMDDKSRVRILVSTPVFANEHHAIAVVQSVQTGKKYYCGLQSSMDPDDLNGGSIEIELHPLLEGTTVGSIQVPRGGGLRDLVDERNLGSGSETDVMIQVFPHHDLDVLPRDHRVEFPLSIRVFSFGSDVPPRESFFLGDCNRKPIVKLDATECKAKHKEMCAKQAPYSTAYTFVPMPGVLISHDSVQIMPVAKYTLRDVTGIIIGPPLGEHTVIRIPNIHGEHYNWENSGGRPDVTMAANLLVERRLAKSHKDPVKTISEWVSQNEAAALSYLEPPRIRLTIAPDLEKLTVRTGAWKFKKLSPIEVAHVSEDVSEADCITDYSWFPAMPPDRVTTQWLYIVLFQCTAVRYMRNSTFLDASHKSIFSVEELVRSIVEADNVNTFPELVLMKTLDNTSSVQYPAKHSAHLIEKHALASGGVDVGDIKF